MGHDYEKCTKRMDNNCKPEIKWQENYPNFITLYTLGTTNKVSCKSYNLLVVCYMFRILSAIFRLIQKTMIIKVHKYISTIGIPWMGWMQSNSKFLNLCQYGEYESMCFGITLKSNDIPVELMNYIYCSNYFSFDLFELGNPVYWTCLMYHSRYLEKQVRCAPLSHQAACSSHANKSCSVGGTEEGYKVW